MSVEKLRLMKMYDDLSFSEKTFVDRMFEKYPIFTKGYIAKIFVEHDRHSGLSEYILKNAYAFHISVVEPSSKEVKESNVKTEEMQS